ncbi:hypothetical protein D3C87_877650 [compost metagenome]
MEHIAKYIKDNKEDQVILINEVAAYFWILNFLGKEIEVEDLDVHVTSVKTLPQLITAWQMVLPKSVEFFYNTGKKMIGFRQFGNVDILDVYHNGLDLSNFVSVVTSEKYKKATGLERLNIQSLEGTIGAYEDKVREFEGKLAVANGPELLEAQSNLDRSLSRLQMLNAIALE